MSLCFGMSFPARGDKSGSCLNRLFLGLEFPGRNGKRYYNSFIISVEYLLEGRWGEMETLFIAGSYVLRGGGVSLLIRKAFLLIPYKAL